MLIKLPTLPFLVLFLTTSGAVSQEIMSIRLNSDVLTEILGIGQLSDVKYCKKTNSFQSYLCVSGYNGATTLDLSSHEVGRLNFDNSKVVGKGIPSRIILSKDKQLKGFVRHSDGAPDYNQIVGPDGVTNNVMTDYSKYGGCAYVLGIDKILCHESINNYVEMFFLNGKKRDKMLIKGGVRDIQVVSSKHGYMEGILILSKKNKLVMTDSKGRPSIKLDLSDYGYVSEFYSGKCPVNVSATCVLIYSENKYLLIDLSRARIIAEFKGPYLDDFFYEVMTLPDTNQVIVVIMGDLLSQREQVFGLSGVEQHLYIFDGTGKQLYQKVYDGRWDGGGIEVSYEKSHIELLIPSQQKIIRLLVFNETA